MGSKYPVLSPNEIIKVLKKYGFHFVSQKSTLKSILAMADIPLDEFLKML